MTFFAIFEYNENMYDFISVYWLRDTVACLNTMTSLLKHKEQVIHDHLLHNKEYQDKDSNIVVNSIITSFCIIHCVTAWKPGEAKEITY